MAKLDIFISSKMVELAAERQALHELLPTLGNELIQLRGWVFEDDAPASNLSIRDVYLNALKHSALYIGLFWNHYGEWTIDEFQRATEWAIDRHIYVKNVDVEQRDPRLQQFLEAQSDVISGITPKWFTSVEDLCEQIRKSMEVWLQDRLQRRPGDSAAILAHDIDDLPNVPAKLIGRDDIIGQVGDLLADNGRVLLQGFGGMGKTALAATIAADWLENDNGAVLWLKAGSENADAMFEALAHPFENAAEIAKATGSDKVRALRQLLQDSEVALVVLDDVWDGAALSQVLKAVPRKMAALVTARQRYALDDIIEIGKLDELKAVELLGYHARQNFKDNKDAAELCRQLGYHAFALEVAGKTLKVDRIAPADLLKRITHTPHDIAMPEDFAEEGRTSITELLDASLHALDKNTQAVFLAFGSLFVGSATPELLAEAMGLEVRAIDEALTTLQRRGLADRSKAMPTYQVHDLAYSYAKAISRQHLQEAVMQAALTYATNHIHDLELLDAERENILGAAQAAREQNTSPILVGIMQTLCGPYLSARGHTLKFLELLDAAIAVADNDETRHVLLSKRGNTYYDRSDLPNALQCYQDALQLARNLGNQEREVMALCVIGKVRAEQGENADGERYLSEAEALANQLDDDFLRAFVMEQQGYCAQLRGDFAETRRIYTEEVALALRIEDTETHYYALLNLGVAENRLSNFQAALDNHQQALQIADGEKNPIWMAFALQAIGEDYQQMNDYPNAKTYFERALALFQESGLKTNILEIETYLKEQE